MCGRFAGSAKLVESGITGRDGDRSDPQLRQLTKVLPAGLTGLARQHFRGSGPRLEPDTRPGAAHSTETAMRLGLSRTNCVPRCSQREAGCDGPDDGRAPNFARPDQCATATNARPSAISSAPPRRPALA